MKTIVYGYIYILIGYSFLLYVSYFLWMLQAIWLFVGLVFFIDLFVSWFRNSADTQERRFK